MSSRPNDFKIGVFALAGIGLLLAALFVFGASKFFEGKTMGETYVKGNVDGLKVGAPVALRGVPVGRVTRINFTWNVYHEPEPRYVYVEFEMNKKVSLAPPGPQSVRLIESEIRKGLRARVKSQGLAAGTSILSLEYVDPNQYPPLSVPWKPRHIYIPSAPGEFSEIISGLDQTIARLKRIDFQKIGELVQADLASGGRLLNHADEMDLRGMGTSMNGLITDLRHVAGQLHTFIGSTNLFANTNLVTISDHADQVLEQLRTTVDSLDHTVGKLDVAALNEALENLRRASRDLDETITRIKQYPSGALFGQPPPPARSVEHPPK